MPKKSFGIGFVSDEEDEEGGTPPHGIRRMAKMREDEDHCLQSLSESSTTPEAAVAQERSFKVFMIHFLRILLSLLILGSFDEQWLHCFYPNHRADALFCRNDHCERSAYDNSTYCWLGNPCMAGGTVRFSLCSPSANSTVTCIASHNLTPSKNSYYEDCPETEGSYCELTANSECTCYNWIIFSLIAVGLHIVDIVCQVLVIWGRRYDPNYLQYHWTLRSDFKMLFNPWNCWVGWYDSVCLLVIGFLQFYASVLMQDCSGYTNQTYSTLLRFCLLLILKESFKINSFVFVTSIKKTRSHLTFETVSRSTLSLLRIDRMARYLLIMLSQAVIFFLSLGLIFPFYVCWYDVQVNIDLYRQKDSVSLPDSGAPKKSTEHTRL
jgi:hypothetical protein